MGSDIRPIRILFSAKKDWEPVLRMRLEGFDLSFVSFPNTPVDPEAFDIVVPLTLEAVRFLNRLEGSHLRPKALVPSDAVIAQCDDKLAFAHFLIKHGFAANVPSLAGPFDYPYILKRRVDEAGRFSVVINNSAEAAAHQHLLATGEYFCQEFISGKSEFATHLLVVGNHVHYFGTVEAQFDTEHYVFGLKQGPKHRVGADHRCCLKLFGEILVRLGYRGLCCVDYKIQKGVVKIFEINPRFGASMIQFPVGAMKAYAQGVAKGGPV